MLHHHLPCYHYPNYAVDETRTARLTPHGAVLFDSNRTLLAPSEP